MKPIQPAQPVQPKEPPPLPPPLDPADVDYTHAAEDAAKKRALEHARARGTAWPFPF